MQKLKSIAVIVLTVTLLAACGGESPSPTATSQAAASVVAISPTALTLATSTVVVAAALPTITEAPPSATSVAVANPDVLTAEAQPTVTSEPPTVMAAPATATTKPPTATAKPLTTVSAPATATRRPAATATTGQPTVTPSRPTSTPKPTEVPVQATNSPSSGGNWPAEANLAVANAKADLAARAGVGAESINVVSVKETKWRNSALGCEEKGKMYMQVIVPGYTIILAANGQQTEYHANVGGTVVTCGSSSSLEQAQAVQAASNDLARRVQGEAAAVQLVSVSVKQWSDSSLGCPAPNTSYADVITPGYLVVLAYNDQQYEYHTAAANRVVLCQAGKPVP